RMAFLSGMVLEFMVSAAIGLVAVTLGVRLLNNAISFEQAFLILLLTPEFYRPLRELGTQRHAGMEGKAALKRILEILEREQRPEPQASSAGGSISSQPLSIQLNDVTCSYPGSERPALQQITLALPPGSITALVGPSGAGKSTLCSLLLRFIDARQGEITANGIDLSSLAVEDWHRYVALVPQRPHLFAGSIYANIQLARADASRQEIEEAARLAGASEFIQQLPEGYDTEIGEQGLRLSAGQAQRLAIARAFLKNAPLLILDEPTSHLDPVSETLVQQALTRLMRNRTVLVIAHRYNTIKHARQIVSLKEGRIVKISQQAGYAEGSWDECSALREGGPYISRGVTVR
ncbi:MAG: ATP-binding cassette domain-containing protein, partial [Ktedonobacteraceae bacterium]|nr:ATP-binding cassette domain-containing protein [Ktedonobacteraceae bacterium]